MLIGEINKKTGLSRDTIRFYEKKGLLKVERTKSEFNNYKEYTSKHLQRLLLIKKAKRFGFTLNEIANLLELIDEKGASCSMLQEVIDEKIEDINRKIQELQDFKTSILNEVQMAQLNCKTLNELDNCQQVDHINRA